MTFVAARSALRPTSPVIAAQAQSAGSVLITLITPSVEPVSGISNYVLSRSSGSSAFLFLANIAPTGFPYTDFLVTGGTTYNYRLVGVDGSSQSDQSIPSPIVSATTPAQSNKKKWTSPQAWANTGLWTPPMAGSSNQAARISRYNSDPPISTLPQLVGYIVQDTSIAYEPGPNPGQPGGAGYQFPYAADVQALAGLGRSFGFKDSNYSLSHAIVIPDYWYNVSNPFYSTSYNGGFYGTSSSSMIRARLDSAALCQRIVARHQYLAQLYPITVLGVNYVGLDNCPYVNWVILDEETQASQVGQATYNVPSNAQFATWDQNWINILIPGVLAAWPKTNVLIPFNWVNTSGNSAAQIAVANQYAAAIANPGMGIEPGVFDGPDTLPNQTWQPGGSGTTYIGTAGNATYTGQTPGSTDYRNKVACMMQVQTPDLPGSGQGSPPQTIINFGYGATSTNLNANGLSWQIRTDLPNGSPQGTGANWTNDILYAIKNFTPSANSNYPALYP